MTFALLVPPLRPSGCPGFCVTTQLLHAGMASQMLLLQVWSGGSAGPLPLPLGLLDYIIPLSMQLWSSQVSRLSLVS